MRNKNQKGFTLIELLVSMSILMILASVLILNFGANSKTGNFNVTIDTLVSNLRQYQSLSISSRDINGVPASAYGLIFTSGTPSLNYRLFTIDNTGRESTPTPVSIPSSLYLKEITVTREGGGVTRPNSLTLKFTVPYGRVVQSYSGVVNEQNSITVLTFSAIDNSKIRDVIINGITGNISVR